MLLAFLPGALMMQAAARDTLLMRPLPPVRTGFESFVFVASGLASVLSLVLLAFLLAVMVAGVVAARRSPGGHRAALGNLEPGPHRVEVLVYDGDRCLARAGRRVTVR